MNKNYKLEIYFETKLKKKGRWNIPKEITETVAFSLLFSYLCFLVLYKI